MPDAGTNQRSMKNIAKENNADARILIRRYMMERFLERIANSRYADNFIIKGGMLVTSMVGVAMRSTMDIDTTIQNLDLSEKDILQNIQEISAMDLGDGVSFTVKDLAHSMDEMEYPGIRITMDATIGKMVTPLKIDISTGDVITPRAIEYEYGLLLENRSIRLWSYNLETILAEKLQTILVRGVLNTRMRDFYDIHALMTSYRETIDFVLFRDAFDATCRKRETTTLSADGLHILDAIYADDSMRKLWESYRKKYIYAGEIEFDTVIQSTVELLRRVTDI